jgi:hypothetical protein
MFFFLNLIYFLFPLIQLFNASLRTQLNSLHGKLALQAVSEKMVQLGIKDVYAFSLIYEQKTLKYAKMLVIVFAVLASLPLNLIYRSRQRYFTDHVGLAVELVCFNLLINVLLLTAIVSLFGLGNWLDDTALTVIFATSNIYFLLRSGYVFYEQRGAGLVLKSILMLGVIKLALDAYRIILFYLTLWTM